MNFVIQEEKEFQSVDVGTYTAKLNKIEEKPPTPTNPDWGPSLMWEFVVQDDGPHRGNSVAAFTPAVAKTGNSLGKLLKQMMGRALKPGEQLDGTSLIGKLYTVFVDYNKTGTRTKVVSAVPVRSGPQSMPPIPAPATVAPATVPPAAPPRPPATKLHVQTQDDYKDTSKWAHFSTGDGLSQEMQIQEMRGRIVRKEVEASTLLAYIPHTAEWIPFSAVDLPF